MTTPARKSLFALRAAIGAGAWVAPATFDRLLGARPDAHLEFVTRVWGIRNLVLAAGLLAPGDAASLRANLAVDVSDACAALLAARHPGLSRGGSMLLSAPAVVAGVLSATELRRALA